MLTRIAGAATAAVTVAVGLLGAGTAEAQAARPAPHITVVNLHQAYEHALKHVRKGTMSGTVYPRGTRPTAAPQKLATCQEPNCPLVSGNGPVQHSPHVYLLLWGPSWSTDPNQMASASYLNSFYQGLGIAPQDNWSPITSQYGDGSGFPTFTGSVYMGEFQDTTTPPAGLGQSQLAAEANAFATKQSITDAADAQIIVATQSGTCPQGFFSPTVCRTTSGYCSWHSASSEPYTNLPYMLDAGTGCGENFINPGSGGTHDGFSIVAGHEYAGAVTDPIPTSGWNDPGDTVSGGEIADKCAWGGVNWGGHDPFGNVTLATGTFAMQSLWSNAANGCVMTAPATDTVTILSPGSQTSTQGISATLQIHGGSSQGHPLTSWSATGLPNGLSINPSNGLISGAPTTVNAYSVTVTGTDSAGTPGSVSFTWTVSRDAVTVTNPGSQTGTVGVATSLQLQGQSSGGFPLTWSAQNLPAGLSINPGTGLISGTPSAANAYSVTVTGTDPSGASASAAFTWTIAQAGRAIKGDGGVCLDDFGSGTTNGNPIDIWACNHTGAQQWTFNSSGTLSVLGMCLADRHYTGAGTKLVLWSCIGNRNEQWTHNSKGEYVLKFDGLCLTDPSGSTVNGTQVEIRACKDFHDQQWTGP